VGGETFASVAYPAQTFSSTERNQAVIVAMHHECEMGEKNIGEPVDHVEREQDGGKAIRFALDGDGRCLYEAHRQPCCSL